MSKFYTYCQAFGNQILLRGYEDDQQIIERVPFKPTLYVSTNKPTEWKSLYDDTPLAPMVFDSIKEAKAFKEQYRGVHGFEVHGQDKFQYQYISDNYKGDINYSLSNVRILTLDVEVISADGSFPSIELADSPITLVQLHNSVTDIVTVLGFKEYTPNSDDVFKYIQFADEKSMLKYFIAYNQMHKFDVWTGWNSSQFDIPYITNRIVNLFNLEMAKKLSPFGVIQEKSIEIFGKEVQTYDIYGIVDLDYLALYKKFSQNDRESYTLDAIANAELGETKHMMPGASFKENYEGTLTQTTKPEPEDLYYELKMKAFTRHLIDLELDSRNL